jgi:F-type H+-transporting ATPase subunit b
VIFALARKPIQSFFAQRRTRILEEMASASDFLKQTEERYAQWQRKLVDLDSELEEIRGTARQRAEEEREQILADARAAAERIRRDAAAGAEQELRRAQSELRREASELAVELAANLLRDRVQDDDRSRLMDEFISSVEQSPSPGGSRSGSEA